ncbi:MAG TPA: shikimate kinase, partial [Planctomycetaceae bacterium]
AVLSPETREAVRRSGPVVYLRVSPETAEQRIAGDATTAERRPALTGLPPRSEIEAVMAAREPLYRECATVTLDADDRPVDDLVRAVLNALPAGFRREAAT